MVERPATRRLRIFAFDPSLATRIDTVAFNELTVELPWEELTEGPVGQYLEVVDTDPASGVFYHPVNLDDPYLLAQNGHAPSESNPQFHQQMVYAVAMTTIRHFERALGRVALWANRDRNEVGEFVDQFVRRLRIYPHALRDRNAYYSPKRKAVLFGYFPVTLRDADNTPNTLVFTCLSHDIIAHEVTHALLDGVHPRFNESTNLDVLAFHEGFADIVALLQHFSYPTVLESQVRRTRGQLHSESLLGQLAQQFGKATGRGSALRDALGEKNDQGVWVPRAPDPRALDEATSPHERGALLVAAVFRAFLLIYRQRTADLFRIATHGTGRVEEGEIHPDLVTRLAGEAAGCASRILQMCIRAIDYCPPVGITFGDFLRGVVTADVDYAPTDPGGYRIVFIEAFRDWGIAPREVTGMGVDALVWPSGQDLRNDLRGERDFTHEEKDLRPSLKKFVVGAMRDWTLESDRFGVWKDLDRVRGEMQLWFRDGDSYGRDYARLFGLVLDSADAQPTVKRKNGAPSLEVHSVRPTLRRTLDGSVRTDLVVEITQRRSGFFDPVRQADVDKMSPEDAAAMLPDFKYRAGCTILIDPRTADVRRVIRTPATVVDQDALDHLRAFLTGVQESTGNAFDAGAALSLAVADAQRDEPFALLHRVEEED